MNVEFDDKKDALNCEKHGVSLADAAYMDFDTALVREDDRQDYGERRWLAAGMIGDRLHIMAFTMRGGTVRPISLRKANRREVKSYEGR
jgi:uncharacterized DUF497 family protein